MENYIAVTMQALLRLEEILTSIGKVVVVTVVLLFLLKVKAVMIRFVVKLLAVR
jgi:hypothetical protein